jgi:hypothetical protein
METSRMVGTVFNAYSGTFNQTVSTWRITHVSVIDDITFYSVVCLISDSLEGVAAQITKTHYDRQIANRGFEEVL